MNPIESYNLVSLSLAKLELYDYLNDHNKSENDLTELLNDCKDLLACSIDLLDKKSLENFLEIITSII